MKAHHRALAVWFGVALVTSPMTAFGSPELTEAIRVRDARRVERLLDARPELADAPAADGGSMLLAAAFRIEGVGFTPPRSNEVFQLVAGAKRRFSIFEAATAGRCDLVRAQVAADRAIVATWSEWGWTPLHHAAFGGATECAVFLLQSGADIASVARNHFKLQPVQAALLTGGVETAEALLRAGAPVDARYDEGSTLLHEAVRVRARTLIALLQERRVDPSIRNKAGKTAYDIAVDNGDPELAGELRRYGAQRTGPAADQGSEVPGSGDPIEKAAIARVLSDYLKVTDAQEYAAIERAFDPSAMLSSLSRDAVVKSMTQTQWWERVSRIPAGAGQRDSRIALIDVAGVAAVARIDIDARGKRSTDYFTLLKTAAGWRIVNKVLSHPL